LEAREFIRSSLGLKSLEDEIFDFVDEPIGSASIGQVHKAKLKRNGRDVAIKIQGPGSEQLFRMDIAAARDFCRVFAPEQVAVFDEIEAQFLTEFDYRKEAENLEIVGNNMKNAGFMGIVVPQPYKDLCCKVVLTMDYLKGPKLIDGARLKGREYADFLGKSYQELVEEWKENVRINGMPKPYAGPSSLQLELYKKFTIAKDRILNAPIYFLNSGLSFFYALTGIRLRDRPFSYFASFIPLNSSFIMDTLLKAHGHQLLIDGFFNADPHPGIDSVTHAF
jgi:aarF domain-containing kinase